MPHLLLVLLAASITFAGTTTVRACAFERLSDEELYAKASAVFVARVVRTEEARGLSPFSHEPEPIVEATIRPVETLKGRPPADGKVRTLRWGNSCSLPLIAAEDYLFFLHGNSYVLVPGGSRLISLEPVDIGTTKTQRVLQKLRALSDAAK
jgi:hypothetical protein